MIYVGIDPGASGGMCVITDDSVNIYDFKDSQLNTYIPVLLQLLYTGHTTVVAVEKVASMTGQGVKSMFSFGQRLGEIHGMLQTLGLDFIEVQPQKWQKYCGVLPKSGKPGIHAAISKLYPDVQLLGKRGGVMDGRCDALSIAHYLKETHGK